MVKQHKRGCCKREHNKNEDDDDGDINRLDLLLDMYMDKQNRAMENWKKLKFRLQIVQSFN